MQDKFPHSARMKTLKNFKYDVVMNLIGKFSSRKRARSSSTVFQDFPQTVPIFIKLHEFLIKTVLNANCVPSKKIDSRTCTFCNCCNLFLYQTSKKIVSGNGISVLRGIFWCKICVCITSIVMLFSKAG